MWFYKTTTGLTDFFGLGNSALNQAGMNTDSFSATTYTFATIPSTPAFNYSNNTWQHLVVSISNWNSSTPSIVVYINGSVVLNYSNTYALPWASTPNVTNITVATNGDPGGSGTAGRIMAGYIAEFQFYNVALNQSQVSQLYALG